MNVLQRRMFQAGGPSDKLIQIEPVNSELIRYYVQQGYSPLEIQEVYPAANLGIIEQIAREEGGSLNPAVSLGESFTGSPVVTPAQRADIVAESISTPLGNLSFEASAEPELPRMEDISVVPKSVRDYITNAGGVLDRANLVRGLGVSFGMSEAEANSAIDLVTGSTVPERTTFDTPELPGLADVMAGEQAETTGFVSEPLTIRDKSTSEVYKLPSNFVEQIDSGLLDGMTLYPIINNPNFEFSPDVQSALERFVQMDEPFTGLMGGGKSFEERRGTFRRPEDIGSATQDIVRGIAGLAEGPIRGIAGLAGEIGGGARLKQRFQESIPDLSVSREELALKKLLQIPGAEKLDQAQPEVTDEITKGIEELERQAAPVTTTEIVAGETAATEEEIQDAEAQAKAEEKVLEDAETAPKTEEQKKADATPPVVSSASTPEQVGSVFNNQNFIRYIANLSKGLAKAGSLGEGIALGSAMAAEERGLRDLEREKADRELLLKAIESGQGPDLNPSDIGKLDDMTYSLNENIKNYEGSRASVAIMNDAISLFEEAAEKGVAITGLPGRINRFKDQAAAFMGASDSNVSDATKIANYIEQVKQRSIRDILNESGRTISNLDREIVDRVFGDLNLTDKPSEILKKLKNARRSLMDSNLERQRNVKKTYRLLQNPVYGNIGIDAISPYRSVIEAIINANPSDIQSMAAVGKTFDLDMTGEFNQ